MVNNKIKLISFILFVDFVVYIFSNLVILEYGTSQAYSIFALCIRDAIIFLFSIVVYLYFCNTEISSMILLPKINNKIIKNSIIIGLSFYFISSGINLIFTTIFKFTLKNTLYLNSIYDLYDLELGFLLYIIIHTILVEIFFRSILNDGFKFLSYNIKLIVTSIIFTLFFFGLSQIFYGFVLGILLVGFLNRVGNITPVVIASTVVNILNYLVKLFGKKVMVNFSVEKIFLKSDIFTDFLFPIIIVLFGLIVYFIFVDKFSMKKRNKIDDVQIRQSNVIELDFIKGFRNIFNIYLLLFISSAIVMMVISYVFLD